MAKVYPQYDIVLNGVREGFDPVEVKSNFAKRFNIDDAKVERIFNARQLTLKKQLEERVANHYLAHLAKIGVAVDKVSNAAVEPVLVQSVAQNEAPISKAIYTKELGDPEPNASAMHQPIASLYGDHIQRLAFNFSGSGARYCKMWLVNLLASLLSAGLLFPWAQVRALRYFYRNTHLGGFEFRYSSNFPHFFLLKFSAIFLLISMPIVFAFSPIIAGMIVCTVLLIVPMYWLKSHEFRINHSYFGDMKFRYCAPFKTTYFACIGWALLILCSFGLLAPVAMFKLQKWGVESHSIGGYPIQFRAQYRDYLPLLPPFLWAECVTIVFLYNKFLLPLWVTVAVISVVWSLVALRWRITLVNLQWSGTRTQFGYFVANWELGSYTKLVLRNGLLCALTLGFYWPWANISMANYKRQHMAFFANQRFKNWRRHKLEFGAAKY